MGIRIREAKGKDGEALKALSAQVEIGGDELGIRRIFQGDFFRKANVHPNAAVLVADNGNGPLGTIAISIRNGNVGGTSRRVGYLYQLFVSPEHRRSGVARRLAAEAEERLRGLGAELLFLAVQDGNEPAERLFESSGYTLTRRLRNPGFAVANVKKVARSASIRSCTPDDLGSVAALINRTWDGHELFDPVSADSIQSTIERIPDMSVGNVLVLEDGGRIRACLAYQDASSTMSLLVTRVSARIRLLRIMRPFLRLFRPIPRIPKVHESIKPAASVSLIGYEDVDHLAPVVDSLNNIAVGSGLQLVFMVCDEDSGLPAALKGYFRVDDRIRLYTKPLSHDAVLSDRPVFADAFEIF